MQREIEVNLTELASLAAFFAGSQSVERDEFWAFVAGFLSKDPAMKEMAWLPRISRHELHECETAAREEGIEGFRITQPHSGESATDNTSTRDLFPVYYVEPVHMNRITLGVDLGSEPTLLCAMMDARDTGGIAASSSNAAFSQSDVDPTVLLFAPVYRKNGRTDSRQHRRENLQGFVAGVLHIRVLLERTLHGANHGGIVIQIIDRSAPLGQQVVYTSLSPGQTLGVEGLSLNGAPQTNAPYVAALALPGGCWDVLCTPTHEYVLNGRSWQPWGAMIAGLIITSLVASHIHAGRLRATTALAANERLLCEVAERTRAESALRDSEQGLRALLAANPAGTVVIQEDTHEIVYANPAALDMIGASEEAVLGCVCHKYVCPAEIGHCPITDEGKILDRSVRTLLRLDGTAVQVQKTVVPIFFGNQRCLLESFVDVSKLRQAEDALQEERNKLRSIVDAMDGMDGMLTIQDREYNIIYQNGQMERVFGGFGRKCYEVYEGRNQVCEGCPVEKAFQDGQSHTAEREVSVLGEEIAYFDNTAHPVKNGAGEITSCVEVVRNVTDRKLAEKARELLIERQSRLNDLQHDLLSPGELVDKLQRVTDGVVSIFGADLCRIWIARPGDRCTSGCMHADTTEELHICRQRDRCLWLMASSGRYAHLDGEVHRRVPLGCYRIGRIASGDESRFVTDQLTTDPCVHNQEWARELGLVSFAGYQLRSPDGEAIGVLGLFAKRAISPEEDALLESLASSVAQVIQRIHAEEEVTRQNRFLSSVLESLTHPFMVIDATDYSVLMANSAARGDRHAPGSTCYALSHDRNSPCDGTNHVCPMAKVKETGKPCTVEHIHHRGDGNPHAVEVHAYPFFDTHGQITRIIEYSIDITERKRAQERLETLQAELRITSHRAGMAEVATGVLHNVGNVLNSVNVSASLVAERMRASKRSDLTEVVALLHQHAADLGAFVTEDERGKHLPRFLEIIAEVLSKEQTSVLEELESLNKNVEYIKAIVSTQQSNAGASGVIERVSVSDLLDDACQLHGSSFRKHCVQVNREYAELPLIEIEKPKLLHILINLISNAKNAILDRGGKDGSITLRTLSISRSNEGGVGDKQDAVERKAHTTNKAGDYVRIEIIDNGVGIPVENLTRVFAHGFTTRQNKGGFGFGLHHSALAARELGGSLVAHSDGPSTGATFRLDIPTQPIARTP